MDAFYIDNMKLINEELIYQNMCSLYTNINDYNISPCASNYSSVQSSRRNSHSDLVVNDVTFDTSLDNNLYLSQIETSSLLFNDINLGMVDDGFELIVDKGILVLEPKRNESLTTFKLIKPITQKKPKRNINFQCPLCPKFFKRNHDLTRHKKIHSKSRDLKCPNCNKGFYRSDLHTRHVKTKKCKP